MHGNLPAHQYFYESYTFPYAKQFIWNPRKSEAIVRSRFPRSELDKAADPCVIASAPFRECDKVREKIHFAIGMREIKLSAAENEEENIAYLEFRNERRMRDTREEYLVSNDTFAQTDIYKHETDIALYFFFFRYFRSVPRRNFSKL